MKKRNLIVCGALAVGLALGSVAFVGCGEKPEPEPEKPAETITFSPTTNPYKDVTWEDFKAKENWTEKMTKTDDIYYQFEGSYSEAYQENYSRTFLYMNCYKDGSMHATYGNENYYGYWTNLDRRGNPSLVLHIVRYNDKEYNDGIYESVCEDINHDFYEYASTLIWNQWGARTVLISGKHYSPVKSIEVTPKTTSYLVGDAFDSEGHDVKITCEDGKSVAIDEQSLSKSDSRIKFGGFDNTKVSSNLPITATYINSDVKTTYNVDVKAAEYKGKTKFGGSTSDATVTITSSNTCEVKVGGKTAAAEYTTKTIGNIKYYFLQKPATGNVGITDAEWDGLHKHYSLNRSTLEFNMANVYTFTDEPYTGVTTTGGRYLVVNEETNTATITYQYTQNNRARTARFECDCTIENGTLTLTKCTSGENTRDKFVNLHKVWNLGAGYVATKA